MKRSLRFGIAVALMGAIRVSVATSAMPPSAGAEGGGAYELVSRADKGSSRPGASSRAVIGTRHVKGAMDALSVDAGTWPRSSAKKPVVFGMRIVNVEKESDSAARAAERPPARDSLDRFRDVLKRLRAAWALTPDRESDPVGNPENAVRESIPDSLAMRLRGGIGYASTLLHHDFLGFRSDSVLADPLKRFGAGYQAKASDFTRDNLKLLQRQAPPDLFGELSIGDRLMNGRLGLLLTGRFDRSYRYTELTRNYDAIDADNTTYLIRRQFRPLGRDRTLYGASGIMEYRIDDRNRIGLTVGGTREQIREASILADSNYVHSPVLNIVDGTLFRERTLVDIILAGRHGVGAFDVEWRGGWSGAVQDQPDHAELTTSASLSGGTVTSDAVFSGVMRDWQHNDDQGLFGRVDIAWKGLADMGLRVTAGGAYRDRDRTNSRNIYKFIPVIDSLNRVPVFTSVDTQPWVLLDASGSPEYATNNYTSEERVAAGYLMGAWESGRWSLLGGARMEMTDARYATFDAVERAQISATKSYGDILPSMNLGYALSAISSLRLSVGQSITRPKFYDLVPYNYVSGDLRYLGNPSLEPTHITSFDLKYDLVPAGDRNYSIGAFYRHIADPIETQLDLSNPSLPTIIPENLGNAKSYGVEVGAGIGFLEYFRARVGYTYTHSEITSSKLLFDKSTGSSLFVPETRPLQGVPEHAGTVALMFDHAGWGTSGSVSLAVNGRRIQQVSIYKGLDHYENTMPILDIAIDQSIAQRLSAFVELRNLLDPVREVETPGGVLIEREELGSAFRIGMQYRY